MNTPVLAPPDSDPPRLCTSEFLRQDDRRLAAIDCTDVIVDGGVEPGFLHAVVRAADRAALVVDDIAGEPLIRTPVVPLPLMLPKFET